MLPVETISAVFPSEGAVGKTRLRPLTLYHAAAMEALGITITEGVDRTHLVMAAWILTKEAGDLGAVVHGTDSGLAAWMDAIGPSGTALAANEAANAIREAFSTFVPPKKAGNTVRTDDLPTGYGWIIEVAELICHEHGVCFDTAMRMPVVTALALVAVMRQRNGMESGGPDFYDRIRQKSWAAFFARMRKEQNNGQ